MPRCWTLTQQCHGGDSAPDDPRYSLVGVAHGSHRIIGELGFAIQLADSGRHRLFVQERYVMSGFNPEDGSH